MNNKTNAMTAKIVEYRFIGKTQLNADDMGGVGCETWNQYLTACSILATSSWNHITGRETNNDIVNAAIAGLFDFFGISVVDSQAYTTRILSVMIGRKAQRSDELKDAIKARKTAKNNWKEAVEEEKSEEEIKVLKEILDEKEEEVDRLYALPYHYYFDPTPMFDKKTKKATPKARKALEDTFADIYTERRFMSADEIQAEAQKLDDARKGRKMRKKNEAKAK